MDDFDVMKKANWDFRKPFWIAKKGDFTGHFLKKESAKKLSNFRRKARSWSPVRPMRRYDFEPERFKHYDDFYLWVNRKISPALSDGWYAFVGFGWKTRRCFSKNSLRRTARNMLKSMYLNGIASGNVSSRFLGKLLRGLRGHGEIQY